MRPCVALQTIDPNVDPFFVITADEAEAQQLAQQIQERMAASQVA